MESLRTQSVLVLVVLGTFGLGVFAAGAYAFVETDAGRDGAAAEGNFTIPVSRLGDRVTYKTDVGWGPTTYEMLHEARMIDHTGRAYDVVVIDRTTQYEVRSNGESHTAESTVRHYHDLTSREPVRADRGFGFKHNMSESQLWWGSLGHTASDLPGVQLQGWNAMAGDELLIAGSTPERSPIRTAGGGGGGGAVSAAGVPVYNRMGYHVSQTETSPAAGSDAPTKVATAAGFEELADRTAFVVAVEWQTGEPPEPVTRTTHWFVDDNPYPIRVTTESNFDERDGQLVPTRTFNLTQVHYEPGSQRVAWSDAAWGPVPELERSDAEARVPADGTNGDLPYPLSLALADADHAVGLLSWQARHADNALVSARLEVGSLDSSHNEAWKWQLVFGTPAGDGYLLVTQRVADAPAPIVDDRGEIETPPYNPDDLPASPVTLASVEDAWTVVRAAAYEDRSANFVHWGFELDVREPLPCVAGITSTYDHDRPTELKTAYLGYYSGGSCVDASATTELSMVIARLDHGVFVGVIESVYTWTM